MFGHFTNGMVLSIDMKARYYFMDTEGWIQKVIPKWAAETITNNVRSDMSAGRYGAAVQAMFSQVQKKINGEKIAEPMRYFSSAAIAVMLGLLAAMLWVIEKRKSLNVGALIGHTLSFTIPNSVVT